MDLDAWVAVADRELAATGATLGGSTDRERAADVAGDAGRDLTAQGLSNKEIGAALFLSPKTIERHLGNVFRKRGVRSRTELAAALARQAPD